MGVLFGSKRSQVKAQIASNKQTVEQAMQQAKQMKDQAYAAQLEKEAVQANALAREKASELEQDAVEGLTKKAEVVQGVQKDSYLDTQSRRESFFGGKTKYKAASKRIKEIVG